MNKVPRTQYPAPSYFADQYRPAVETTLQWLQRGNDVLGITTCVAQIFEDPTPGQCFYGQYLDPDPDDVDSDAVDQHLANFNKATRVNAALYNQGLLPTALKAWTDAIPDGLIYLGALNGTGRSPLVNEIVDQMCDQVQEQAGGGGCSGMSCQNLPWAESDSSTSVGQRSSATSTLSLLPSVSSAWDRFATRYDQVYGSGGTEGGIRARQATTPRATPTITVSNSYTPPDVEDNDNDNMVQIIGPRIYLILESVYPRPMSRFVNGGTTVTAAAALPSATASVWDDIVKTTTVVSPFQGMKDHEFTYWDLTVLRDSTSETDSGGNSGDAADDGPDDTSFSGENDDSGDPGRTHDKTDDTEDIDNGSTRSGVGIMSRWCIVGAAVLAIGSMLSP